METARTKQRRETRERRLAYFDKLTSSNGSGKKSPPSVPDSDKNNQNSNAEKAIHTGTTEVNASSHKPFMKESEPEKQDRLHQQPDNRNNRGRNGNLYSRGDLQSADGSNLQMQRGLEKLETSSNQKGPISRSTSSEVKQNFKYDSTISRTNVDVRFGDEGFEHAFHEVEGRGWNDGGESQGLKQKVKQGESFEIPVGNQAGNVAKNAKRNRGAGGSETFSKSKENLQRHSKRDHTFRESLGTEIDQESQVRFLSGSSLAPTISYSSGRIYKNNGSETYRIPTDRSKRSKSSGKLAKELSGHHVDYTTKREVPEVRHISPCSQNLIRSSNERARDTVEYHMDYAKKLEMADFVQKSPPSVKGKGKLKSRKSPQQLDDGKLCQSLEDGSREFLFETKKTVQTSTSTEPSDVEAIFTPRHSQFGFNSVELDGGHNDLDKVFHLSRRYNYPRGQGIGSKQSHEKAYKAAFEHNAFTVENMLKEMRIVRHRKSQLHEELKSSFNLDGGCSIFDKNFEISEDELHEKDSDGQVFLSRRREILERDPRFGDGDAFKRSEAPERGRNVDEYETGDIEGDQSEERYFTLRNFSSSDEEGQGRGVKMQTQGKSENDAHCGGRRLNGYDNDMEEHLQDFNDLRSKENEERFSYETSYPSHHHNHPERAKDHLQKFQQKYDEDISDIRRTSLSLRKEDDEEIDPYSCSSNYAPKTVKYKHMSNGKLSSHSLKDKERFSLEENSFDLGTLCTAAKQGDDVLRTYIKRLSQKILQRDPRDLSVTEQSVQNATPAGVQYLHNLQSGQESNNLRNKNLGRNFGQSLQSKEEDYYSDNVRVATRAENVNGTHIPMRTDHCSESPKQKILHQKTKGVVSESFAYQADDESDGEAYDEDAAVIFQFQNESNNYDLNIRSEFQDADVFGLETHRPSERSYSPLKVASFERTHVKDEGAYDVDSENDDGVDDGREDDVVFDGRENEEDVENFGIDGDSVGSVDGEEEIYGRKKLSANKSGNKAEEKFIRYDHPRLCNPKFQVDATDLESIKLQSSLELHSLSKSKTEFTNASADIDHSSLPSSHQNGPNTNMFNSGEVKRAGSEYSTVQMQEYSAKEKEEYSKLFNDNSVHCGYKRTNGSANNKEEDCGDQTLHLQSNEHLPGDKTVEYAYLYEYANFHGYAKTTRNNQREEELGRDQTREVPQKQRSERGSGKSHRRRNSDKRPLTPDDHREKVREYHMKEKERRPSTNEDYDLMQIQDEERNMFRSEDNINSGHDGGIGDLEAHQPTAQDILRKYVSEDFAREIMNIHNEEAANSDRRDQKHANYAEIDKTSSFDSNLHIKSWKNDPQFAYSVGDGNKHQDRKVCKTKNIGGALQMNEFSQGKSPSDSGDAPHQTSSVKGRKAKLKNEGIQSKSSVNRPRSAKVSRSFQPSPVPERRWASSAKIGVRKSVPSPDRGKSKVYQKGRAPSSLTGPGGDAAQKKRSKASRDPQNGEFFSIKSSEMFDGTSFKTGLPGSRYIPPLTLQLIENSPRESQRLSIWQLLPDEILLRVFSYLEHPDLFQCALSCRNFYRVAMDTSLWKHISLEGKKLSDLWLTQIGEKCPVSLSLIKCNGDYISENGLRNIFRSVVDTLQELNISGCTGSEFCGDSVFLHASRCYNLRRVDASWCNVTDNGLNAIVGGCNRLVSVCLNGCPAIPDSALRHLVDTHSESLVVLELFGCIDLSPLTLSRIGNNCKLLTTLNIGQCYKITDESVFEVIPKLKSLINLDLRGVKQVRDDSVRRIVRSCKKLESLVLANCTHVTNASLADVSSYLKSIRILDVSGCKKISNEGVQSVAMGCNKLTHLNLSLTSIDRKGIMSVANYSNKCMEELKLNCCKDVTEASIIKLLKHCKRLKTLHLFGVKGLRNLSVLKLQYPCIMYDGT